MTTSTMTPIHRHSCHSCLQGVCQVLIMSMILSFILLFCRFQGYYWGIASVLGFYFFHQLATSLLNFRKYQKLHHPLHGLSVHTSFVLHSEREIPQHEVQCPTPLLCDYHGSRPNLLSSSPETSIIVVGYREDPVYWKKCLSHLYHYTPPHFIHQVLLVIDGREEEDLIMKQAVEEVWNTTLIHDDDKYISEEDRDWTYTFPKEKRTTLWKGIQVRLHFQIHQGKRHAMTWGIRTIQRQTPHHKEIMMMDSDTLIYRTSIPYLIQGFRQDSKNGCMTGNLFILNKQVNLLTRIVHARYGYAFFIERGSMSFYGCMNCCSGPFSIYRQSLLTNDVLQQFVSQQCCGDYVGPGDDRHLTNLILVQGWKSRQHPLAIVTTETPTSLRRYLQQQLRWSRSFYREQWYQIQATAMSSWYLTLITTWELCMPFWIMMAFFPWWTKSYVSLFHFLLLSIGMTCLRTLCLFIMTGYRCDYGFHLGILFLYFFILLPLKFYALFTCWIQHWITSSRQHRQFHCSGDMIGLTLFFILWYGLLISSYTYFFWTHPWSPLSVSSSFFFLSSS